MTEIQKYLGQIEVLKEHSARLYNETKELKYKLSVSEKRIAELEHRLAVAEKEKSALKDVNNNLAAENKKAYQTVEVLQEYNRRLNERVQMSRRIAENQR